MMHYSLVKDPIAYYRKMASRPKTSKATSIYKGVSRRSDDKWICRVSYRGVRTYVGTYATELEAAAAYNEHALRIIGPNAIFNQLPNDTCQTLN